MSVRILVVMNLFPPHSFGGYEDLCEGATQHWSAGGHDVEVLASRWRRADIGATNGSAVPVHRDLPMYWDDHEAVAVGASKALAWEHRARRAMRRHLRRFGPDVVSLWNVAALPLGIMDEIADADVPMALVLGDRWLEFGVETDGLYGPLDRSELPGWAEALHRRLGGSGLPRLSSRTVALFASDFLRAHAVEGSAWPLEDAVRVPHGLDISRYPIVEEPPRPWRGRMLYVGRVAPEKGIVTAVRALVHLPDARLEIWGGGPEGHRRDLVSRAAELGVAERMHLRGEGDHQALRRAYRQADVLVVPSQWDEPFGIVPLEGMSSGVPVVATGTGGSGEFLVDGLTCLRFAPRDDEALAAAVRRLAQDAQLRERLVSAGRAVAAWLDRGRTYDDLLAWHRWVTGTTSERPSERSVLPPALTSAD